jgi:hypothetical protein
VPHPPHEATDVLARTLAKGKAKILFYLQARIAYLRSTSRSQLRGDPAMGNGWPWARGSLVFPDSQR